MAAEQEQPGNNLAEPATFPLPITMGVYAAKLNNPSLSQHLDDIEISEAPEELIASVALAKIQEIAHNLLKTSLVKKALLYTFNEDDAPSPEELDQAIEDGCSLYIAFWLQNNCDAYHVSQPASNIQANNVFLKESTYKLILSLGTEDTWTSPNKYFVLQEAFFLLHERCHALATILQVKSVIESSATPTKAIAYAMPEFGRHVDRRVRGERGFWVESRLGGLLFGCPVPDAPQLSELLCYRPDLNKYYTVSDDFVDAMFSNDAAKIASHLPIFYKEDNLRTITKYEAAGLKGPVMDGDDLKSKLIVGYVNIKD